MEKKGIFFALAFCQLILAGPEVFSQVTTHKMSFGQTCNSTSKCDTRSWLACNNGTCGCLKPENMIYEPPKEVSTSTPVDSELSEYVGKCVLMTDERCNFNIGVTQDGQPILDTYPCVQNSVCSSEGICSCNQGFYEQVNGTCTKYLSHMDICDPMHKCSTEAGLECSQGLCQCKSSPATFDIQTTSCVGVPGSACLNSTCTINSECRQGLCECKDGFHLRDKVAMCVPKASFDEACRSDVNCKSDNRTGLELKCIDGKCACDPDMAVYGRVPVTPHLGKDQFRSHQQNFEFMCAPKAKQSCAQGFCAPNAYCVRRQDSSTYSPTTALLSPVTRNICECLPDATLSNTTGLCGREYEADCHGPGECRDGLVCKGQTCSCQYEDQRYNSTLQKCTSPPNGPCSSTVDCFKNSNCIRFPGKSFGHCQCNDGFMLDNSIRRRCKLGFNQRCSEGTECHEASGLSCIESRCQCKRFSAYSLEFKSCVGLVGSQCIYHSTYQCTANATCLDTRSRRRADFADISLTSFFTGQCKCDEGFTETEEYTCAPVQSDKLTSF